MRVLLFAGLAEAVGCRELLLPGAEAPSTVRELEASLRGSVPALSRAPFRVAVNRAYASPDQPLAGGDEVALIPPVSGG